VALAAVLATLAALPAIAIASSSATAATASNSQTYTDSTGEDPAAPDITTIVVSNDDAGNITFQVNISNRPTFTQDMLVDIFLDTDKNATTGDTQLFGADYVLEMQPGAAGVFQWNGQTFASGQVVDASYAATGATFHINARDLGATQGFNFVAIATSGVTTDANGNPDFTNAHDDVAPDVGRGTYSYQVLAKLTLSVNGFTTSPAPPKSGRTFSAGLAVSQSDTGSGVTAGTITCSARIAGKQLTMTARRVVDGVAVCVWLIPGKSHGKTVRGSITLTVRGSHVTRSFAARVG
jgi:hypothetical protein